MPALYVGCADNIAHADKTAMGAFENPSAWRVPLAAYRACLAGKFFVHIVENGDTFGLGFVADIFTHSATPSSPAPRPAAGAGQCRTCRARPSLAQCRAHCIGIDWTRYRRSAPRPVLHSAVHTASVSATGFGTVQHRDAHHVQSVRDWVLTQCVQHWAASVSGTVCAQFESFSRPSAFVTTQFIRTVTCRLHRDTCRVRQYAVTGCSMSRVRLACCARNRLLRRCIRHQRREYFCLLLCRRFKVASRLFGYCIVARISRQEMTRPFVPSVMAAGCISPRSIPAMPFPVGFPGWRPSSMTTCQ